MIIYIFETNKPKAGISETAQFSYDGNRIPKKKLDEFFKAASEQLKVPEEKLEYETF